jgi:hypothetical protein
MNLVEVLQILLVYIGGSLLSLIVTGLLVNKFVIKKIMANKDVLDTIKVFRDGKELLKEILENQKHDKKE